MSENELEVQPLNEWRLRRHWSHKRLAGEARVSTETLYRAAHGGRLHAVTQRKIADALGVKAEQILEFRRTD